VTSPISRSFRGHRPDADTAAKLPPGQYETHDFPVLSAGPTPHTPLARWDFTLGGMNGQSAKWSWAEFQALPHETITRDIHCVTKWSKFDTVWNGVSIDMIIEAGAAKGIEAAPFIMAVCDGGYTTNLPLADVTGGKAWLAAGFDGKPLPAEHGGPVRLLVPHLYFWKSAKWVREIHFHDHDEPGFWEGLGYHMRGDPWKEQRYTGDA
jgi:DMSO/TMAO reductase YedYZ molybdopterin-dependent catalytic subunit